MTSILYAIGFTLMFCICAFFGWSDDAVLFKQLSLMFSGFCLGGMALCVIDEIR